MHKIILHVRENSDGILALRAANTHIKERPEWPECIYKYVNGQAIFVRRNKSSWSSYEEA